MSARKTTFADLPSQASIPMTTRNADALQQGWERIAKGKPRHRLRGRSNHAYRSPKSHPMQRLEALEEELRSQHGNTGANRWMVPYADLLTLLLGLFLMLMALATQHGEFLEGVTENLTKNLQAQQAHISVQQAELLRLQEALGVLEEKTASESTDDNSVIAPPAMASNGDISVSQDERGLVITLLDSVLFTPGSASLSPSAKATLTKVAKEIKALPNDIRIEGHTDNTPIRTAQFPNNWYLSTARATTIVEYLIVAHRFSPKRLSAAGYGEHHPVAKNSSIEGKRQNRRVDIIVLDPKPASGGQKTAKPATTLPAVTPTVTATNAQ